MGLVLRRRNGTGKNKVLSLLRYHATFDIYRIYSVRENRNIKIVTTYGHSAGRSHTDHYTDSHLSREFKPQRRDTVHHVTGAPLSHRRDTSLLSVEEDSRGEGGGDEVE